MKIRDFSTFILVTALTLFCVMPSLGQDENTALKKQREKYNDEVAKIEAWYAELRKKPESRSLERLKQINSEEDKARDRLKEQYIAYLERTKKQFNDEGKLDETIVIDNEIMRIEGETMAKIPLPATAPPADGKKQETPHLTPAEIIPASGILEEAVLVQHIKALSGETFKIHGRVRSLAEDSLKQGSIILVLEGGSKIPIFMPQDVELFTDSIRNQAFLQALNGRGSYFAYSVPKSTKRSSRVDLRQCQGSIIHKALTAVGAFSAGSEVVIETSIAKGVVHHAMPTSFQKTALVSTSSSVGAWLYKLRPKTQPPAIPTPPANPTPPSQQLPPTSILTETQLMEQMKEGLHKDAIVEFKGTVDSLQTGAKGGIVIVLKEGLKVPVQVPDEISYKKQTSLIYGRSLSESTRAINFAEIYFNATERRHKIEPPPVLGGTVTEGSISKFSNRDILAIFNAAKIFRAGSEVTIRATFNQNGGYSNVEIVNTNDSLASWLFQAR